MPDEPAKVEPLELDDLTFEQEVEATMLATGVPKPLAEFMASIRRGDVEGDTEEVQG